MSTDWCTLTKQFEAREIDPIAFRHIDHIGVAYEMFHQHGFLQTVTKFAEAIESMATKAGAPEKFNITITLAFLSVIAERIQNTDHANFDEFMARNEDLLDKNALKGWYSEERLSSSLAQGQFLLPDKIYGK